MDWNTIFRTSLIWMRDHGPRLIVIILVAFLITRLVQMLSIRTIRSMTPKKRRNDMEFIKRLDTLDSIARYITTIVVFVIAGVMILGELGVQIGPIMAAAGVVGLAIGFGAQSLVKDLISGFFILLEDQIRVGDVVEVAGKSGVVERLNLKMTILRDLSGNVHFVPNGEITVVTNMTKGYSRYLFNIGVAYREDVDEVMKVMAEIDEELRNDPAFREDILAPLEILGLDEFGDSALIIKARTMTKPIQQWRVGREFNRRLKKRFDELGIEIPFPHVTLYMGQDKNGASAPLRVQMEEQKR